MSIYGIIRFIHPRIFPRNEKKKKIFGLFWTWILSYMIYMSYHIARKPISVVKNVLNENCTTVDPTPHDDPYWCDWAPFNDENSSTLLGLLDSVYLFAYAIGMTFLSGRICERINLNVFLCCGMILSGFFTASFGLGYTFDIHSIWYYFMVQLFGGLVLSSGWPGVVTAMGNWFGKSKRGLIMGVWNSHTSVGNIIGTLIAGAFLDTRWDLSFIVPGCIIASLGVISLFLLIPDPKVFGLETVDEDPSDDVTIDVDETVPVSSNPDGKEKPISFLDAFKIPGVISYSACLFFAKLVSYTFLFWLPNYILEVVGKDPDEAAFMSTYFDIGGVMGGIIAGHASDKTRMPAIVCSVMLILAVPALFFYQCYAATMSAAAGAISLMFVGFLVNGPYALITTAVSTDLGTHSSLKGNSKALSTVTSIIDGTGSFGAAIGPLLAGALSNNGNWSSVFYMMMTADVFSFLMLSGLNIKEVKGFIRQRSASRNQ